MSGYGINLDDVALDMNYRTLVFQQKYVLKQECFLSEGIKELSNVELDYKDGDIFVAQHLSHNDSLNKDQFSSITASYDFNKGKISFGFCPLNAGSVAYLTIYKFGFAQKKNNGYGMEVYDDKGNVVFGSQNQMMIVKELIDVANSGETIKKYNHKVGFIITPTYTIPGATFGVYETLSMGIKSDVANVLSYSCYTSWEVDGEYSFSSTKNKPTSNNYPSMIVVDLSNINI